MKKTFVFAFTLFMVFGMLLHSPLVLAEGEDDDNSGSSNNEDIEVTIDSDSSEEKVEDKETDSRLREKRDILREREASIESKEIITENNCTIKIERKLEIKNGRTIEVVKKERICADGSKTQIKTKVEKRENAEGRTRERIVYESENETFEAEAEEGIKLEEENNGTEYKLKARLRSGNVTIIKIMPDRASQVAIDRLKSLNFTIELREVGNGSSTRAVYFAETDKKGRFLGIFKTKVKLETQIDPETGEVIRIAKPWWALLVSGEDSDQTTDLEEDTETEGAVTNQVPAPGNENNVTEMIVEDQASGTSITLDEDEDGVLDTDESDIAA